MHWTNHFKFNVDNTYDVGASGATRPRDLFLGRDLAIGRNVVIVGTTVFGTIVSDLLFTDATYDIGKSSATRPRDIFLSRTLTVGGAGGGSIVMGSATVITLADGAVGAPAIAFNNDPDCGLYRVGTNDIALATNGAKALEFDSTQFIDSPTQPRCVAYNNATQSINDNTTTAVTFNSEDLDVSGMHDTGSNTSRITIPTGADGLYWVRGFVRYPGNATGQRITTLRKNGSTELREVEYTPAAGSNTECEISWLGTLAAADYVELLAYQNTGGALSIGSATRKQSNELAAVKLW